MRIAHKYGSYEGAEHDTGIIYASQPFLLAVYTQNVGELISAKAAELLYQYTEYQYQCAEAERLAAEQAGAERLEAERERAEQAAALVQQAGEEPEGTPPSGAFEWWMLAVALGVFAVGGGAVLLTLHSGKKYHGKHVIK